MKKIIIIWTVPYFLFVAITINAQQQLNLPLLSNWDDNTLPVTNHGSSYSDCWGYVDSAGREYAIIGSTMGSHFFDITNPTVPVLVGFKKGKAYGTGIVHRDYKTYQHYCYAVCDEGASSLQIFDLQYLPDSVVTVYDSDVLSTKCHNIFIEGDKLFMASNSIFFPFYEFHSMDVLSLSNPKNPTFISTLTGSCSYTHDVYVRNDTAYCSCGSGLFAYDYTNAASPQSLMSITSYPEQYYNHSSWLTNDSKHLVWADEGQGRGLKIYDISDLSNASFISLFRSNLLNISPANGLTGSIPHNPFIVGDRAVISYYHDGVQIFDISDPANPQQIAYYDTYPQNIDYQGYQGCWGVYPFLPSGHIIASDMSNGLFILDGSLVLGVNDKTQTTNHIILYPNPSHETIYLCNQSNRPTTISYNLIDLAGKLIREEKINLSTNTIPIDIKDIAEGMYILKINIDGQLCTKKIIKN
ncbi:MAG: choice-of-anchor B family protein [Bacteroidota bacterium]